MVSVMYLLESLDGEVEGLSLSGNRARVHLRLHQLLHETVTLRLYQVAGREGGGGVEGVSREEKGGGEKGGREKEGRRREEKREEEREGRGREEERWEREEVGRKEGAA